MGFYCRASGSQASQYAKQSALVNQASTATFEAKHLSCIVRNDDDLVLSGTVGPVTSIT